ncbi:polysaccharide pyruvyl transferase family protein [Agrobacterium sp. 33MFTa1.1]|nr:polysaccharide pyruvyl transferase family protein [Agrobacterium sp. 33MFTa1.1]
MREFIPMKKLNIIFSTTRQWNPGDEFILQGVRNVLKELEVDHCPVIYNRNPDIRPSHQDRQLFRTSKLPSDFNSQVDFVDLEANLKLGFFDNSVKPDTNCEFVDWVIMSGTPEWCSARMTDLYSLILRYNLPVMIIGVGGNCDIYHESYREVISKSKLLTVRDHNTFKAVLKQGFSAEEIPCPALLSAKVNQELNIQNVKKIALIYHATADDSVIWNGFSSDAFNYTNSLYRRLLSDYAGQYQFSIVCHYIDEIPLARRDFPDLEIEYSFESKDYYHIYSQFDLVVGPRVHGVGVAASLGVPGIAISHDSRGSTTKGFLAEVLSVGTPESEALAKIADMIANIASRSAILKKHKRLTMDRYKTLVRDALNDRAVSYQSSWDISSGHTFTMEELRPLASALEAIKLGAATEKDGDRMGALAPEIRTRLINIENKINHLMSRQ